MTYVSCYYHAFQGAQQVGTMHPQKPQVPHSYYNVTKTFLRRSFNTFYFFFILDTF